MFQNIPAEMRTYRQWICWRLEWKKDDVWHEDKPTKIPYKINGDYASVTDPSTWDTFDNVVAAVLSGWKCVNPVAHSTPVSQSGFSGIGFVLTEQDPYTFCDLDDTKGDELALQRQLKVFQEFDSYSEKSPSGKGLHIIVKASIPKGRRRSFIELYSKERYMTMTGDVFKHAPINERQPLVSILWEQLGGGLDVSVYDGHAPQLESDEQIIATARGAVNGPKFSALYDGDWTLYFGPHMGHDGEGRSEADFALIDILAFYTQNKEQIRRLFLSSQLGKRDKAQRWKYVDDMIMRSFDRMLPPIDIINMREQLELQLSEEAARRNAVLMGEPLPPELEPQLPFMSPPIKKHLLNTPPGLLGEIARFIYNASPTPIPEIALAGAIGVMAGVGGRSYNISGAGLNQYMLCLAPTGSGKEAIATGISHLFNAIKLTVPGAGEFRGPGTIRSDAALLRTLAKKPCFFSIIGEFGIKLKAMSSQNANSHLEGLRAVILDLYNKSGAGKQLDPMVYSDSDKNTNVIEAASFTLIGESTPEKFYQNLDENMITEGLLPRFTIIEYDGPQPPLNKGHELVRPDFGLTDRFGTFVATCLSLSHENKSPINVKTTDEAALFLDELREFARSQTNNAEKDVVRQLWSRVNMKTLKLAALLAVGVNHFEPVITLEFAEWAKSLVVSDVMNILKRFKEGDIGRDNEETKQEKLIKKACLDYLSKPWELINSYCQGKDAKALHAGRMVSYVYIQRRVVATAAFRNDHKGATIAIKRTLDNLIAADCIREVPRQQIQAFGTRQRCFMVEDLSMLTS